MGCRRALRCVGLALAFLLAELRRWISTVFGWLSVTGLLAFAVKWLHARPCRDQRDLRREVLARERVGLECL